MELCVCAFNSIEMKDEELVKDGLNVFVYWDMSLRFQYLLNRYHEMKEKSELSQIQQVLNMDLSPLTEMCSYWDEKAAQEYLNTIPDAEAKEKRKQEMEEGNSRLISNIAAVENLIILLQEKMEAVEFLESEIVWDNDVFYRRNAYFSKTKAPNKDNFYEDVARLKGFLEFVKPLDADTVYFNYNQIRKA